MKQTEQILNNKIVLDFDEKKSSKEILTILSNIFGEVSKNKSEYNLKIANTTFTLLLKNITYLGHPHPAYKKRIQLSNGWETKLKNQNTFVIGLYNYKETRIFVFFDKKNYAARSLNNSSAHVWTFDLLKGNELGIFHKTDSQKNNIYIVREDMFLSFLQKLVLNEKIDIPSEFELIHKFKETISKTWFGIDCYKEMIADNFSQKYQSEWGGSFLEFKFSKFLNSNTQYNKICNYQQNKNKESVDLDLNFNNTFLGDLKTHNINSNAILGNDFNNINKALKQYGKIWYIVINHETIKDSKRNYEVTRFWNQCLNKSNLMSYSSRMKNTITLKSLYVLEINNFNKKYLSSFKQGKNSNGKPRNLKIKINKASIDNFLILKRDFI